MIHIYMTEQGLPLIQTHVISVGQLIYLKMTLHRSRWQVETIGL